MKRLAVLGSTGSIGTATLDVIRCHPARFRVVALAAGRNLELLRRQIGEFRPGLVGVAEREHAEILAGEFPAAHFVSGAVGLEMIARADDADMVVGAVVGVAGLAPTLAAVRAGKDVALANKESLVAAGELVMAEAEAAGVRLLPIDSEHCALHQLLDGRPRAEVERLILTASGGPFRDWSAAAIRAATIDQALAHPTWRMGPKISIDSATLVNKGLEIIEAHHLFGFAEEAIDVVIHPQSLVHAAVALSDSSVVAQLADRDMRLSILYALSWPERPTPPVEALDLTAVGRLDFEPPDTDRFPGLELARAALRGGGELPAVFNAANEAAVEGFLAGRCSLDRVPGTIAAVMDRWPHRHRPVASVEQALAVDAEARRIATRLLGNA